MSWQPIETAPRDGTAVIVMRDIWPGTPSGRAEECNGHNTYIAQWWGSSWVCYMGAIQDPKCPIEPTHWQPLPPSLLMESKMINFTVDELELFREWFGSVQDMNPAYLKRKDYELAKKLCERLGHRVPNSINKMMGDGKA